MAEVALGLSRATLALAERGGVRVYADTADDWFGFNGVVLKVASRALLEALGLKVERAKVVNALGVVREVEARHPSILALGAQVTVLALRGWREWSAAIVADGLQRAGVGAVVAGIDGPRPDASVWDAAGSLAAVPSARPLLVPPILTEAHPDFGQAVPTTPSVLGPGFAAAARAWLGQRAELLERTPQLSADGDVLRVDDAPAEVIYVASVRAQRWLPAGTFRNVRVVEPSHWEASAWRR